MGTLHIHVTFHDPLLIHVLERLERAVANAQQTIDQMAAVIGTVTQSVNVALPQLQTSIQGVAGDVQSLKDQLANSGVAIDTTSLEGNVAQLQQAFQPLQSAADALKQLDDSTPAPTPPTP